MKTIGDLDPGRRLLVRVDVNAPLKDGRVQDHSRFERHAESIETLLEDDHAMALLAHQGRPGRDTFVSLEQHAEILSDHLEREVGYVPDVYGDEALSAIRGLEADDIIILENVRFTDAELADNTPAEHAETEFIRTLAPEFDAYLNDGYSAAHRAHASIVGFPEIMDAYAGPVMQAEYENNTSIQTRDFDGRVTMVLGGKKAEDVIAAMEHLETKVDRFLMGGVVGELFLRAEGHPVGYDINGTDLYDDLYEKNEDLIDRAIADFGDRIDLPVDLAFEDRDGERAEHVVEEIDEKTVDYLDVGERTVERYAEVIDDSAAVMVKGALGVFEDERFADGTVGILEAIAVAGCFSVVGGGDTSRAVELYGLDPGYFDHLSIAGGAYLRALTGEPLPAVEALERAAARTETDATDLPR